MSLPSIDIRIKVPQHEFLDRMAELAQGSTKFEVEKHYGIHGRSGFDIVNLRYLGRCAHERSGGQLIAHIERPDRIEIEMHAQRWTPDDIPSREIYVQAARELIGPVLRTYNATFNGRHRFRIEKASTGPRLPPRAAKLFHEFAALANTSSPLHPCDWRRFYRFVRGYRSASLIREEEMGFLLRKAGFDAQVADRLSEIYAHLCDYKRHRADAPYKSSGDS